jgi:CCR4-NOT transcription complex subunit 7/8
LFSAVESIDRSQSPFFHFTSPNNSETLEIRNVWAENVEEEMRVIRELVDKYPYVSMDTEFPGVVAKPVTETYTSDYHYKSLKLNVDLLKIIQLGLSFSDEKGNLCKDCPCWQFNFAFDLDGDMFAQDSIDLLVNSGISFPDHATRGIDPQLFGELLMVSGLVLDDRVKWVTYHAGYDFAYLLKILTTKDLPSDEKGFFEILRIYFPTVYDIKYMTSLCDGHRFMGGLQRLADDLGCQRLGAEHQAGSDSLLTKDAFFALIKAKFQDNKPPSSKKTKGNNHHRKTTSSAGWFDDTRFANEFYGYGNNHTVRKGPSHQRDISSLSNSTNE